jgi:RNA polymerase sigma-70 factor (ECF subfamily)
MDAVTEAFERQRPQLRAVAYRMLGSLTEADDAVQEAWLRLHRSDTDAVQNLAGWLTTVTARVALDMLRSRHARREDFRPEPIVAGDAEDPEREVLYADAVGLALLVVLETLSPAERLAFVLHDMFAVPFEDIAPLVDRTPGAARQLASRARRRVRGSAPAPDADLGTQQAVVEAFMAAAREGDFDGLLELLDPDVVLRAPNVEKHGAGEVLAQASRYFHVMPYCRAALVNGAAGVVMTPPGRYATAGFTVAGGRIVAIDIIVQAG